MCELLWFANDPYDALQVPLKYHRVDKRLILKAIKFFCCG